jgi:hypothetical protein
MSVQSKIVVYYSQIIPSPIYIQSPKLFFCITFASKYSIEFNNTEIDHNKY